MHQSGHEMQHLARAASRGPEEDHGTAVGGAGLITVAEGGSDVALARASEEYGCTLCAEVSE